jgi:sugar transferase (PEP-CTERM/EpsH1 system associated)
MRILIVSAQLPYPPRSGFAVRVYQLARRLSESHEVTLLSYARAKDREAAAELARELPVRTVEHAPPTGGGKRARQLRSLLDSRPYCCQAAYSRAMEREIHELCAHGDVDAVQLESSYLCALAVPASVKLVLDEHNIEYEVFRRMFRGERSLPRRAFNQLEHVRFRRYERAWWRRADGCLVTSERERQIVSEHAPDTPVAVVPNGVDLNYFRARPPTRPTQTVLFNGTLDYRPNVDGAQYLIERVWPLVRSRCPAARLLVVGRADPATTRRLSRPGVEVVGEVPDVRPYLERAMVVAVPVRIGGGTRLKVLEALAMGKAIVSTTLGCEGIAVRDGEHLLLADDTSSFAERVVQLLERGRDSAALGRAGRELIERRYSWELAAERAEALYAQLEQGVAAASTRLCWRTTAKSELSMLADRACD